MNSPLKIKGGDKDSFLDRIYYLWRHLYNGFFYMAKQDFKLDGEHQDKLQESILGFFEWFTDSKNKKQQKSLLTALAVVVLGVVAWGYNASSKNTQNGELQDALGQAMVFQEQGDVQKAKAAQRLRHGREGRETLPVAESGLPSRAPSGQIGPSCFLPSPTPEVPPECSYVA